jgi:hypothetical protein
LNTVYLFFLLAVPATYVALTNIRGRSTVQGFLLAAKGAGLAVPSLLLPAILQAVLPGTYRPFPHFLVLAAGDHCALLAGVTAWWIVIKGYQVLEDEAGKRRWEDYLSFASGFYTMVAAAFALSHGGEPDLYTALMLPVLRVSMILLASLLLIFYFESYGLFRFAYAAAYVLVPFAAAGATWLAATHYTVASVAATAALAVLAGLAWFQRESF